MTKTDLIAQVAANTEMSKKSAEMAVNAAFEALGTSPIEGRLWHIVKLCLFARGSPTRGAVERQRD